MVTKHKKTQKNGNKKVCKTLKYGNSNYTFLRYTILKQNITGIQQRFIQKLCDCDASSEMTVYVDIQKDSYKNEYRLRVH